MKKYLYMLWVKINYLVVIDLDVLKVNIFFFSVVKVDFSSFFLYFFLNLLIFFFLSSGLY